MHWKTKLNFLENLQISRLYSYHSHENLFCM